MSDVITRAIWRQFPLENPMVHHVYFIWLGSVPQVAQWFGDKWLLVDYAEKPTYAAKDAVWYYFPCEHPEGRPLAIPYKKQEREAGA